MLLLSFLVHVIHTNGRPISLPRLDSRLPNESCDDINNCRKLFDITWSCLATIFACTWVSMHPNVPAPNQCHLALLWRRLKLMLIAIIAPELMVGFAARQFFTARSFSIDFNISRTHGFFICMGGFVSRSRHNPIVTKEQLQEELGFIADIRAVEEEDIKDKSTGDALSKGLALVQGIWFATQCLARVHQRLPVSELEVTTLAFAVLNVFIYALWWGKPLDVQRPILVGPQKEVTTAGRALDGQNFFLLGCNAKKLHAEVAKPWRGSIWVGICGATNGYYGKDGFHGKDYEPTSYTSVPSFWATASNDPRAKGNYAFYIECLVGTIFGGIHCAVWNTDFPSVQEMWMWKSTALVVALVPVLAAGGRMAFNTKLLDVGRHSTRSTLIVTFSPLMPVACATYPIARLFLIILPLIALRALPPRALTDVNWSVYIPHL